MGFICRQCGFLSDSEITLTKHLKKTHGGVLFTCMSCGKDFNRRNNYNRHRKNFHPETVSKPSLSYCPKLDATRPIVSRTFEVLPKSNNPKFMTPKFRVVPAPRPSWQTDSHHTPKSKSAISECNTKFEKNAEYHPNNDRIFKKRSKPSEKTPNKKRKASAAAGSAATCATPPPPNIDLPVVNKLQSAVHQMGPSYPAPAPIIPLMDVGEMSLHQYMAPRIIPLEPTPSCPSMDSFLSPSGDISPKTFTAKIYEPKWKLIPIDLSIDPTYPKRRYVHSSNVDPRIVARPSASVTSIISWVSIPSPVSDDFLIENEATHVEKSSNYLPVIAPEDTTDYTYKDDPIYAELMKDLFLSDTDSEDENATPLDEPIQLAVNHLESLKTPRGNSRA